MALILSRSSRPGPGANNRPTATPTPNTNRRRYPRSRPVRYPVFVATFVALAPTLTGNRTSRTTSMWSDASPPTLARSGEQGLDELLFVEVDEVGCRLAETDELHRDPELGLDGEHDAALRRAVELGEHDAGDVDCLRELLCLHETVLPRRGVEHEQHLGDLAGLTIGDTANLAQLFHQVGLGVEPPGGVGEHEVGVLRARVLHGVEDHGARVATLVAAHDGGTRALGPQSELLGSGGAERVAGRHHDRASVRDLALRDLADGRRLADTVHPDEQPHVRLSGHEVQFAVTGEARLHLCFERFEQRVGSRDAFFFDA